MQELRCFAYANNVTFLPQIHFGGLRAWRVLRNFVTAFSRSLRYRWCQCTSDHNSLSRARGYECRGQHLYCRDDSGQDSYPSFAGTSACPHATTTPRYHCITSHPIIYLHGVFLFLVMLCRSCFALNISWFQHMSEKGSLLPHSGRSLVPILPRLVASQPFTGDALASPRL